MANTVDDLRTHLFDTIRGLKDSTMDVDRARAIAEVAREVINSAKVEVDHMRVAGGTGSAFIPQGPGTQARPRLVKGSANRDS